MLLKRNHQRCTICNMAQHESEFMCFFFLLLLLDNKHSFIRYMAKSKWTLDYHTHVWFFSKLFLQRWKHTIV